MSTSPDLGIAFVAAGQAQPEVTMNEGLLRLQSFLVGAIDFTETEPVGATDGDVYLVGPTPTGDNWTADFANKVAIWYAGAWLKTPDVDSDGDDIPMGLRHEGMAIYVRGSVNVLMRFNGVEWLPA